MLCCWLAPMVLRANHIAICYQSRFIFLLEAAYFTQILLIPID